MVGLMEVNTPLPALSSPVGRDISDGIPSCHAAKSRFRKLHPWPNRLDTCNFACNDLGAFRNNRTTWTSSRRHRRHLGDLQSSRQCVLDNLITILQLILGNEWYCKVRKMVQCTTDPTRPVTQPMPSVKPPSSAPVLRHPPISQHSSRDPCRVCEILSVQWTKQSWGEDSPDSTTVLKLWF